MILSEDLQIPTFVQSKFDFLCLTSGFHTTYVTVLSFHNFSIESIEKVGLSIRMTLNPKICTSFPQTDASQMLEYSFHSPLAHQSGRNHVGED